ncbi:hypothetical protein [Abyssisolibacter fermentans]|uniref:hypothetical protein n=1 Tax=Abyssisolibacter fermentans TaxID=1766203 RepID=UPI000829515E|nr:hypothetical protein [Abyssisolibacter fermentans]
MNKKISLLLVILTITMLSGCYDNTKKAFDKYLNTDLKPLIGMQNEVLIIYENLLQTKDLNAKKMQDSLDEKIIPQYEKFVTKLEGISSEAKEVNKVHKILVTGAKKQLEVFITLRDGLSNNDTDTIYYAEELLKESKKYMENFNENINELKDRY